MKHFLKKLAYKTLGQRSYLKLLSSGYKFMYGTGMLKKDPVYKFHYFTEHLVHKGDTVLDIGANVGYYSLLLAKWVGNDGKLVSVEPVPDFFEMLKWNTRKFKNITYYNYALGTEEKQIELIVPMSDGYLRTGLANVKDEHSDPNQRVVTFTAEMKKASELFAGLPVINFIKMDIEGYEEYVLPEMKNILEKHKPILQVETWGRHKPVVQDLLHSIGYLQYELPQGKLVRVTDFDAPASGDYVFVHPANSAILGELDKAGLLA